MPHFAKESHLEEICNNCSRPHGNDITLLYQHHKIYEIIECVHCGYEIIKRKEEVFSIDRHEANFQRKKAS
jgi:Zn ribbon nucleic-acid-binding protein